MPTVARWSRGYRVAIALAVVSLAAIAAASLQERAGFLWIAESGGVLNIATDSGELRFEIQTTLGTSALAVNDYNGDVWAYGNRRLLGFDRSGTLRTDVETPVPIHGGDPADLIVDGGSGTLWLAIKRDLYRYDLQGALRQTLVLPRNIVAATLDRDRSTLWVAQDQQLRIYDPDGALHRTMDFGLTEKILDVAYDRRLGEVWVVMADRLQRYDAQAARTWEVQGSYGGAIAPDGSGGVWLARDGLLVRHDPAGARQLSLEPFAGQPDKAIVDVVADPHDASVWVASRRSLAHYAVDGERLAFLADAGDGVIRRLSRGALYADLDAPELAVVAPAPGALLNNNRPALELSYFDLGVGVDPDSIRLSMAGAALPASCEAGATTARCAVLAPLPEGEVTIRVTIADRMLNVSEATELRLTIDTVPPSIRIDHPAPDAVTNQPALTIRGGLSEAGTVSLDGTALALDDAFGFGAQRALREGPNSFALLAADRAGNSSAHTLRVTLDTVPPAAPQSGAIEVGELQGDRVTVTGAAGAVEPGATVRIVNQRTGQAVEVRAAGDGSFQAAIAAAAGDALSITVVDRAGNASEALAAQVKATPLAIIIESPAEGAVVTAASTLVTGKVVGVNASVSVNGVRANVLLEGSGLRFYANVPLQVGSNSITAMATFFDRPNAAVTRSVSHAPGSFSIRPSALVGGSPLTVTYVIEEKDGSEEFYRFLADLNGDGFFEQSGGTTGSATLTHTYATGTHSPVIRIQRWSSSAGQYATIFQEAFTLVATSTSQTAALNRAMIQAAWEGLTNAMIAKDVERALAAFSEPARVRYGAVLTALQEELPEIAGDMSHIELILLRNEGHASYLVMTSKDGLRSTFVVSFLRDRLGVWRIESM